MKTAKKVLHIIMIAVVCCFVLFAAAKLVKSVFMKQPLAHTFGYATVTIQDGAGSMSPTLVPGDSLLIKKQKTYAVGDIVTYYDADVNGLTTHRIVEVTDEGYITKGDANNALDGVVKASDIQGKMINKLSGFEKYCLSIWGFLTLVLIVFAIDTGFAMIVGKKTAAAVGADGDYEDAIEEASDKEENIEQDYDDMEADAYEASVDAKKQEDK